QLPPPVCSLTPPPPPQTEDDTMMRPDPAYEQAAQAARDWFRAASADPARRLYLYYLPHGMRLAAGTDAPRDRWELAYTRHISPAWTKSQACRWIWDVSRRPPLYPVE